MNQMNNLIVILFFLFVSWANVSFAQQKDAKQANDTLYMKAQEFVVLDSAGKEVKLSDFRGKNVLVDFGATWCTPCQSLFQILKSIYKDVKREDLVFISVSLDEKKEDWLKSLREEKLPWLYLWDKNGFKTSFLKGQFHFQQIPHLVLLNKEGKVVVNQINVFFPDEIKKEILKLYEK